MLHYVDEVCVCVCISVENFAPHSTLSNVRDKLFPGESQSNSIRFLFMGRFVSERTELRSVQGLRQESTFHVIIAPIQGSSLARTMQWFSQIEFNEHLLLELCFLASFGLIIYVGWYYYLSTPEIFPRFSTVFFVLLNFHFLYLSARGCVWALRRR